MVDAAVGSKAVFGRGIEKNILGLPTAGKSGFSFVNFETLSIARNSKENPSLAITGFGGQDRGTPGEVGHDDKVKYDLTVDRVLLDLVAMLGKPDGVTDLGGGAIKATITNGGTLYDTATVAFDPPPEGGTQATATLTVTDGKVTGITLVPGAGYLVPPAAVVTHGSTGSGAVITTEIVGPWLVKIRPGAADPPLRALSLYLAEGGSYTGSMQYGRRCQDIQLTEAANKRVQTDITYTEPTGDSISGLPIAKSDNGGSADIALFGVRGRRPYDSNYYPTDATTPGKSLYIHVNGNDDTAGTVTFNAAFDEASGKDDGTGFPTVSYGSFEFVARPGEWVTVTDSNDANGAPIGLFGENNEPFEITIGDIADVTVYHSGDQFEIPVSLAALSKTVKQENRISTFHLTNAIDGASVLVDSGTTKWMRPFKAWYTNSRRFPSSIDPTGDLAASMAFKKRLFDIAFRIHQEAASRVAAVQTYKFGTPLLENVYEGIEIFYPQMRVDTLKSGDIPNKNTLEESVTLMAEQPDSVPSQPTSLLTPGGDYFDASAWYPWQINAVTVHDPTWFAS